MGSSHSGDYKDYYLQKCEVVQKSAGVSEERPASIFRFEEKAISKRESACVLLLACC
jgi:hypothetical protein